MSSRLQDDYFSLPLFILGSLHPCFPFVHEAEQGMQPAHISHGTDPIAAVSSPVLIFLMLLMPSLSSYFLKSLYFCFSWLRSPNCCFAHSPCTCFLVSLVISESHLLCDERKNDCIDFILSIFRSLKGLVLNMEIKRQQEVSCKERYYLISYEKMRKILLFRWKDKQIFSCSKFCAFSHSFQ